MRIGWLFVLAVLAAVGVRAQNAPDIMPLDQVREGMTGYGETVFKGTKVERFEFEVIGFQDHWKGIPKVIMVRVFGGPKGRDGKHILDLTHIMSGMSGSPAYVDGKLIGAVAFAPEFQTTSKGFITPIGEMLKLKEGVVTGAHAGVMSDHGLVPGSYFNACIVWGDTDGCWSATVTARFGDTLLATGHALSDLPAGPVQIAVWPAPVENLLETQSSTMKLSGTSMGPIAGTLVRSGSAGSVIVLGREPDTFTVTGFVASRPLSGVRAANRRMTAVAMPQAVAHLRGVLGEMVSSSVPSWLADTAVAEVSVELEGVPQPVRIVDHAQRALNATAEFLELLTLQHGKPPRIKGVSVGITVDDERPPLVLRNLAVRDAAGDSIDMLVLASRMTDRALLRTAVNFPLPELTIGQAMVWLDGGVLQDWILKRYTPADVLPQLAAISDRRALYLVTLRNHQNLPRDGFTIGRWDTSAPTFTIYGKLAASQPLVISEDNVFTMVLAPLAGETEPGKQRVDIQLRRMKLAEALEVE